MVRLTLTLMDDGSLNVTGPIENRALCSVMLETAGDWIREYAAKKEASRIVVPVMPPPNGIKPL